MKVELGSNGLYQRYSEIREALPLFYCKEPFQYNYVEGGVYLSKTVERGFYKCEETSDGYMRVYDTYIGILISKGTFNYCFKKPSKLRLFLYKNFIWI